MNDYVPVMEHSIPLAKNRRIVRAGLVFLSLTLGQATGFAQDGDTTPTQAQMEQAKEHYANAKLHHDAKEYMAAADEYDRAYAVFPNAEFIFNAAQVYRLAGEQEEALKRYEKYIELAPKGRGAADARMHRSNLKRAIEAGSNNSSSEAGIKAVPDIGSTGPDTGATGPDTQVSTGRETVGDTTLTSTAHTTGNRDEGKTLRIAGLATVGAGVAALGVGLAYGLGASSLEGDVEGNTTWNMGDYDDGKAAERNMFIFYGVGATALAAGSVMYFLGRSAGADTEKRSLTIAPTTGAGGSGFVLGGRF